MIRDVGDSYPLMVPVVSWLFSNISTFVTGSSQGSAGDHPREVEVITPEEYMGNIIGDLNSRRGIVNELGTRSNLHVVNASVPLAEMFSYIAELRNLSKGRANYSMEFEKYEPVPENVAETIEARKWDTKFGLQFSDLFGHYLYSQFSVRFLGARPLATCKDVIFFSAYSSLMRGFGGFV